MLTDFLQLFVWTLQAVQASGSHLHYVVMIALIKVNLLLFFELQLALCAHAVLKLCWCFLGM